MGLEVIGRVDPLTNPAIVVFAAILPLLTAVIQQRHWPTQVNALIAFIAYVVVGVAGAFLSGEPMTAENLIQFVGVVSVVGTVAYNMLWSNIGVTNAEGSTSLVEKIQANVVSTSSQ